MVVFDFVCLLSPYLARGFHICSSQWIFASFSKGVVQLPTWNMISTTWKWGKDICFKRAGQKNAQSSSSYVPIGSVGLVYWPIFTIRNQPNVGNYTANIYIYNYRKDVPMGYLFTNQPTMYSNESFQWGPIAGLPEKFRKNHCIHQTCCIKECRMAGTWKSVPRKKENYPP